jgi:DDE superfamily endonuclease
MWPRGRIAHKKTPFQFSSLRVETRKESGMVNLPNVAEPLLMPFCVAFTEPTFQRSLVLLIGAILARGRRTITNLLWNVGDLAEGDPTDYHRIFSRAPWSTWKLGRVLATAVIQLAGSRDWIRVAIDCTVAEHKGTKVYGKGCHHDAVRSTSTHTAYRWGHRWIVLAVIIHFPFCNRPWALPILAALYRPEELNKKERRRHKTPIQIAQGLVAALLHWFPDRKFVVLGDGGYASHDLARFCHRHRERLALVSKFVPGAALYALPPKTKKSKTTGRPRVKGKKLKSPEAVVASSRLRKTRVSWYGASKRAVQICEGRGQWYRAAEGLVPVHWVFVRDVQGTRRDEYFFTTHNGFTAEQIVTLYTLRWNLEVTFQELRAHLGFETPRQWVEKSVLRMAPCLLGLFSVISLIYNEHLKRHEATTCERPCYTKTEPTFADAIVTVRQLFWQESIFTQPYFRKACKNLPPKLEKFILDHFCQAV